MRTHILLTALLLVFGGFAKAQKAREVQDFNFDWQFHLGELDNNPQQEKYNDDTWRTLDVPHDWSIEQDYTTHETAGSTGFLPTGIGWYRKTFTVATEQENRVTHIEFDGIYCNSTVWINGKLLGHRPYGYSPITYDLTPHLNYGGENTIAVHVDHSNYADSRWYTGSGIYRNVRLVTTNKTFVPRYGVWVTTPKVDAKLAVVNVTTVIEKRATANGKNAIKVELLDPSNKVVGTSFRRESLKGNDTLNFKINVKNPKLWDIDTPQKYTARVTLNSTKKELSDVYETTFGLRSFRFDANTGFYLNGRSMKLKGVCLHHDGGAIGGVFIRDVWLRRLNTLKRIGVNAIRMAHNPADPGLLELCDELGFVVMNESFDEWRRNKEKWATSRFAKDLLPEMATGYGDYFEKWAEQDTKDMVRYSRNHPSIIMWSVGNEIEWTYPYYWKLSKSPQGLGNQVLVEETGDGKDEMMETAKQLKQWVKEMDPYRPVTAGSALPESGNITGFCDVFDAMGYNYSADRYDEDHKTYPNRVIYGSENWGTYAEWKDAVDRDFVSGVFLWTGIAYLGESGPFPWKGLEISLMDFCGFMTPRGHFFQTLWSDKPYTYLATQHAKKAQWAKVDGTWTDVRLKGWLDKWLFDDVSETWNYKKGDEVFVEVYSNSPEVELLVNGKSMGKETVGEFKDHIAKFSVPYAQGEVKAIGWNGDKKESEYVVKTAKWTKKVALKADKTTMKANGYDVVHIEANLVAGDGSIVPDSEKQIHFTVEGEGVNIGVDNGWERNVQSHKADHIITHNGKAMLLIQSTRKAGEIKITARCGKMKSEEIVIVTE